MGSLLEGPKKRTLVFSTPTREIPWKQHTRPGLPLWDDSAAMRTLRGSLAGALRAYPNPPRSCYPRFLCCICIHIFIYTQYVCTHIHLYRCVHMNMFVYIHIFILISIHMYLYMCGPYVHMYVYIYIHGSPFWGVLVRRALLLFGAIIGFPYCWKLPNTYLYMGPCMVPFLL